MNSLRTRMAAAAIVALQSPGAPAFADGTLSGQAIRESGQAIGHASAAAAHGLAASGRAVLGVSAVPLAISGSVLGSAGALSATAAGESARAANAPIGTPLEITDETITVVPPDQALKAGGPAAKQD